MSENGEAPRDKFMRDDGGETVAVGHHFDSDKDEYWTDERLAEMDQLNIAAQAFAPSLIGLTVEGARELVAQHPDLSVLFIYPGHGYPAMGVFGQIAADVRDDLVVSAQ